MYFYRIKCRHWFRGTPMEAANKTSWQDETTAKRKLGKRKSKEGRGPDSHWSTGCSSSKRSLRQYNHTCRHWGRQRSIFHGFWQLGNWDLQTSFLFSFVELQDPNRPNPNANYQKGKSCTYMLEGHRVYKEFSFLKTLDVSNKRITMSLTRKFSVPSQFLLKQERAQSSN